MTKVATIGATTDAAKQAELDKLVDYQNMIYQRLLLVAKLRQQVKAQYPLAVLPFDTIFGDYVRSYNQRTDQIKANSTNYQVGVQQPFDYLSDEFGPQGSGIGFVVIAAIVVCIIAAIAATTYTITEIKRQNAAAEKEIKGLDKLLGTFKTLPGANAGSLTNLLAKIDYVPGGTPPPATGLTSTLNTVVYGGVIVAALYFGSKFITK